MSDTQVLLSKITALRQRLEQAQGLASEAGKAVAGLVAASEDGSGRLHSLERRVADGLDQNHALDGALRQLTATLVPDAVNSGMPSQLTSRARRVLERGRDLLARLRTLGDDLPEAGDRNSLDPLVQLYRETAAMTDTTLRTVLAFPETPSTQLRLCEGLEAVLGVIAQRLEALTAATEQRHEIAARVSTLAELLVDLNAGQALDIAPYVALAEAILDEAHQAAPLRFLYEAPQEPARFVACHSLTVAQVIARVARQDPDLRARPLEPVLAALVHDVGMLCVPVQVLCHAGPLDDAQRRSIESHVRASAALAVRLLPSGAWLAEAVAAHHERLDGTGYPDGLREHQLTPLTRLLAVCDVYAALCSPRPHRVARETRTAMADTLLLAEQGALDRQQAERLLQLSFYPVGAVVQLADGTVGIVVATPTLRRDLNTPARPVLALLTDHRGQPLPQARHLDLAQCESRSIVRTLTATERRDLLGLRYPELV
jgi:HD-GYP domain-containing protein (c-di-GMP phosphodiesterase class II)